jgi:hypothetical protein
MIEVFEASEIVACAIRPQGSWIHLFTLIAFSCAALRLSQREEPRRTGASAAIGSRERSDH